MTERGRRAIINRKRRLWRKRRVKPLRIAHIITSLEYGGAQMMLVKLLRSADRAEAEPRVFGLSAHEDIAPLLNEAGAPFAALNMRPSAPSLSAFWRLTRQLRAFRPHIVQTWMPHADLMGGIAAKFAGCPRVVWNIRQSSVDPNELPRRTMAVMKACAALSDRLPTRIVSCSTAAADSHAAFGYPMDKIAVIPNGFDTGRFQPNQEARVKLRRELRIEPTYPVVGIVCRYHEKKDLGNFLQSAARLLEQQPSAHFILCGEGMDSSNAQLNAEAQRAGMLERLRLIGQRPDTEKVYPAFDLMALTSAYGEGFPNVVGEAMACGVPCAVTDVGESRQIVGETGFVVPPRNLEAMSAAWIRYFAMAPSERAALGEAARARVKRNYGIRAAAQMYMKLYKETARREV